jgi:hypothetical protein
MAQPLTVVQTLSRIRPAARRRCGRPEGKKRVVRMLFKAVFLFFLVVVVGALLAGMTSKK